MLSASHRHDYRPSAEDRPPHDGSVSRTVLACLAERFTVADLAAALRWDYALADSHVHRLRRLGLVRKVGEIRVSKVDRNRRGYVRLVGLYQRVRP